MESDFQTSEQISFVIRLWLVDREWATGDRGMWRGQIIHVKDSARRYVSSIDEIVAFILVYLDNMETSTGASDGGTN